MPGCQFSLAVTRIAGPEPPASSGIGLGLRLGQHLLLHRLPFLVEPVERLGDLAGLDRIVGREQPAAERRVADAPAGIDARADQEAERWNVPSGSPMRDTRASAARPALRLLARRDQPLDHEGPVQAGQRHHVADGRQRDQVEHRQQIGLRGIRPLDAQQPRRLHQREKDDAGRAEMPLPRQIVLAVGIDHRDGHRQRPADLVVVEHDDLRAGQRARRRSTARCWCRSRR